MRFEIDINRGEAIIGSARVDVCAVGSKGYIQIGGKDGPVLKQITFGERTLAHRNSCHAEKYVDFLSATITHTATVSPGAGEQNIVEIIALHLAGAGNDAPSFTETANRVSKSTGWSAEIIDSHPAAYIDSLYLQLSGDSKPWRKILLAPSKEESILSLKHHLAISIFRRGSDSSGIGIEDKELAVNESQETGLETKQPEYSQVKENHAVNRQKILSLSPDDKIKSNALKDLPEDKTLKPESKRPDSNLPKKEQNKKSPVFLKSVDDKNNIEQFPKDLPASYSKPVQSQKISSSPGTVFSAQIAPSFKAYDYADENTVDGKRLLQGMGKNEADNYFYFSSKAVKNPIKGPVAQKNTVLSDETVNNAAGSSESVAGFKQPGRLPGKQNKSIPFKRYKTDKNKTYLMKDAAISSLESSTLFPSLVISLEQEKSPLISSAKKSLRAQNIMQNPADSKKPDTITPEEKYDQKHDIKKVYNLPEITTKRPFVPKDIHFDGNRPDTWPDIRDKSHDLPKDASSANNINTFSGTADEIAMLLHHEADLRGIER